MTELLEWPFDGKVLCRKKNALKRELLAKQSLVDKRIAVLGGSTTHDVIGLMELFLLNNGIRPTFYESEYNKWWEDGVFGTQELDEFNPDIVFVHTSVRNIKEWPAMDAASAGDGVELVVAKWRAVWEKIEEKFKSLL